MKKEGKRKVQNLKILRIVSFINSFQLILSLSLWVCISLSELYSIKPFYFTENMIHVKLDPEAANTADSYHLKSGRISSKCKDLP